MKYLLSVIVLSCLIACSNQKKPVSFNAKWFNGAVKKSDSIAKINIKSYLDTISGEKLYSTIIKRFGKNCYPIDFVRDVDISAITFCNIPNFYISKSSDGQTTFTLDTTQTSVFMQFEEKPFAMAIMYSFKEIRFLDLIQGVDSAQWERYNSRIQQGYTVFECKKIIDVGNNQKGNAYLPYIFYTKENSEIFVYEWVHKKDLTLSYVADKWLKE